MKSVVSPASKLFLGFSLSLKFAFYPGRRAILFLSSMSFCSLSEFKNGFIPAFFLTMMVSFSYTQCYETFWSDCFLIGTGFSGENNLWARFRELIWRRDCFLFWRRSHFEVLVVDLRWGWVNELWLLSPILFWVSRCRNWSGVWLLNDLDRVLASLVLIPWASFLELGISKLDASIYYKLLELLIIIIRIQRNLSVLFICCWDDEY